MKEFIYKQLVKIAHGILDEDSIDLSRIMKRRAAEDTITFIDKEFPKDIMIFNDNQKILEYAFLKSTIKSGLILEFGVYGGYTINIIATQTQQNVYGFDSFEGLPEDWRPGYDQGTFKIKLPKVKKNVILIKGWFNQTLPQFIKKNNDKCKFIHIDSDLYSSAKTVLNNLRKNIVPGTVIAFNDFFNYPGWREGESKAFFEFVQKNNLKYEYLAYHSLGGGVVIRITK
jgi:predicted O-methyltransferase YrrM